MKEVGEKVMTRFYNNSHCTRRICYYKCSGLVSRTSRGGRDGGRVVLTALSAFERVREAGTCVRLIGHCYSPA